MKTLLRHPSYGPYSRELGWCPSPSYLQRRHCILGWFQHQRPGLVVLEYGCGAGALLRELNDIGHETYAIEISDEARRIARGFQQAPRESSVSQHHENTWPETFDVVMAFEVLEHIEDDRGTLHSWFSRIKPGGILLASVPAHQKSWSCDDVWAGHFRRYEREELRSLLESGGFSDIQIDCIGFPLSNISRWIRILLRHLKKRKQPAAASQIPSRDSSNKKSGIDRRSELSLFFLLDNRLSIFIFRIFSRLQEKFFSTEMGDSYFICARRD